MDNLNHLHTFYTVALAGSLTAAAKRLHISQSAVSHSLKTLETQLGTQLIERSKRRFLITEHGRILLAACESIFVEYETAIEKIQEHSTGLRGELRVGCHVTLAEQWLVHQLPEIKQLYPELDIQLELNSHPEELLEDLDNLRSDMAIIFSLDEQVLPSTLNSQHMADITASLVASPEYLYARGTPQNARDFKNHHFIEFHRDYMIYHRTLRDLLGMRKLPTFGSVQFMDSSPAIRQACRDGIGIGFLGTFFVAEDVRKGRLVEIMPERLQHTLPFRCVYRQSQSNLLKLVTIRELLRTSLQQFMQHKTRGTFGNS